MSKSYLLTTLLAVLVLQAAISQELKISVATNKYTVENVISNETFIKDTLYKKTLKWLYQKFPETGLNGTYINGAKNKIESHQYFNPAPEKNWGITNPRIGFVLICEFQERKFKYNFTNFYYFSSGDGKVPFDTRKFQRYDTMLRDSIMKETNQYVKKLGAELVSHLQNFKAKK